MSFTSVVLPPPFGPTMQTFCPVEIERLISRSTGRESYENQRLRMSTARFF